VRVEYSPITTFELICGLLRGRAMLDAAQARLAHRMRGHIDEAEILEPLNDAAYQEVDQETRDLENAFLKAGVRLAETTNGIANPGALTDAAEQSCYSQAQQAIRRAVVDITGFPEGEIVLPPAPER
jgi:hypothetical protein